MPSMVSRHTPSKHHDQVMIHQTTNQQSNVDSIGKSASENRGSGLTGDQDRVIRADLFGRYMEQTDHRRLALGSQHKPPQVTDEDTDQRSSDYQVADKHQRQDHADTLVQRDSDNDRSPLHVVDESKALTKMANMSWTGQYVQFMHQLEKMKRELEAVGEENVMLANLITEV